jgi:hypothetical protein
MIVYGIKKRGKKREEKLRKAERNVKIIIDG